MNIRRIEKLWLQFQLSHNVPGDEWASDTYWGMYSAEHCASHGCARLAAQFFRWALGRYQSEDREAYVQAKAVEVRILEAAFYLWRCNCMDPLFFDPGSVTRGSASYISPVPMMLVKALYFPALSDEEYKLAWDALERGISARKALWPQRRRTKTKYIALMAAAQTITQHANKKN
jgi:hypothetical protein